MFQPFQTLQYNCTNQLFASFILKISRFSAFFSTFVHCSSSKFTTTTAQFPFYNCKLHFTTAQIVISCTLKYALPPNILVFPLNIFDRFMPVDGCKDAKNNGHCKNQMERDRKSTRLNSS